MLPLKVCSFKSSLSSISLISYPHPLLLPIINKPNNPGQYTDSSYTPLLSIFLHMLIPISNPLFSSYLPTSKTPNMSSISSLLFYPATPDTLMATVDVTSLYINHQHPIYPWPLYLWEISMPLLPPPHLLFFHTISPIPHHKTSPSTVIITYGLRVPGRPLLCKSLGEKPGGVLSEIGRISS